MFKKSERSPLLVAPGKLGTNPTGSATASGVTFPARKRNNSDNDANVMRVGQMNPVRIPSKKVVLGSNRTKTRKLGDVLDERIGDLLWR